MRKWVALAAVAGLGALVAWLALRDGRASSVRLSQPVPADGGNLRRARVRAVLDRLVPQIAEAGALSGKVVGPGAAGAQVALQGTGLSRLTTADTQGRFHFGGLAAGAYRVDASSGALAAETLGPIPLGAGEQLGGLLLQLSAAGALSGQVLDAQTRAPLAAASLSCGGASATTDAIGRFTLSGIPSGSPTLTISCAGYVTSTRTVAIARDKPQTGTLLLLTRAAHVAGRVEQSDGTAVPGALVFAERYDFGPIAQSAVLGTTGPDGTFQGDLAPGRVTLRASAGNGEAQSPRLELHPGDSKTGLQLVVDIGGDIDGQVLQLDGTPAAGAQVFAVEVSSQRASRGVSCGADGSFQLAGLPAGDYAVVARSGSRAAQVAGIHLDPGDVQHAVVKFGAGSIDGTVSDENGQPLVGAQVSAAPEGAAMIAASGMESGPQGQFHFEGLAGARFTLRASSPAGQVELHGVAAGATGVELRIATQSELFGVVFGDDGQAVTDFQVVAEPLAPQGGPARASGHFASAGGRFHLPCAAGSYRVRVAAEGYTTADVGTASAAPQGRSPELQVTLHRSRSISGSVVDARTQKPISGATVATRPNLLYAFGRASPAHLGGFTVSESDGSFMLSDAESGEVRLFASAPGYGWAPPVLVPAGSSGPVQISLSPSGGKGPQDFAGVGMQIAPNFTVGQVFDSGPADLAGLRQGDQILSVDGQPVAGHGLGEVVGWIRGAVGTPVALQVSRAGQVLTLTPTRAEIEF